ncbi:MAG: hypothetical protein ACC631_07945, partial [Halocynthiibacter sp.]
MRPEFRHADAHVKVQAGACARVSVIYHHFPHYRRPVLHALVNSGEHDYRFWGSHETFDGIRTFSGDSVARVSPLRFRYLLGGRLWHLRGFWPAVLDRNTDVLILHAPPNMPAGWLIALGARLTGKKLLFWVHGWLYREPRLKAFVRRLYFGLGHGVMTYSDRSRRLASAAGFDPARVIP